MDTEPTGPAAAAGSGTAGSGTAGPVTAGPAGGDAEVVAALRARDEVVFARLLDNWSRPMLRLARTFVSTADTAEEVVQEAWLAVVAGIDRFEGRSSLRTWVFRILVNIAKNRAVREKRTIPFASLGPDDRGPTVDPARFRGPQDRYPGHWREFPAPWAAAAGPTPEGSLLAGEVRSVVDSAVDALPHRQRTVIVMRDVIGHSSEEVCALLGVSAANQRVLLHRGRAAVRERIAGYFAERSPSTGAP